MLGVSHRDARIWMIRDTRWKYVYCEGMRPMLWDLESDPESTSISAPTPAMMM